MLEEMGEGYSSKQIRQGAHRHERGATSVSQGPAEIELCPFVMVPISTDIIFSPALTLPSGFRSLEVLSRVEVCLAKCIEEMWVQGDR